MRAAIFVVLSMALGTASAAPLKDHITLDAGTLAAIEKSDPDRFRKLARIISLAAETGCASAPKVLEAQFHVSDARCETGLFLTSDPPKRRLSFRMDDVRYDVDVTLRNAAGSFVPIPSAK